MYPKSFVLRYIHLIEQLPVCGKDFKVLISFCMAHCWNQKTENSTYTHPTRACLAPFLLKSMIITGTLKFRSILQPLLAGGDNQIHRRDLWKNLIMSQYWQPVNSPTTNASSSGPWGGYRWDRWPVPGVPEDQSITSASSSPALSLRMEF